MRVLRLLSGACEGFGAGSPGEACLEMEEHELQTAGLFILAAVILVNLRLGFRPPSYKKLS